MNYLISLGFILSASTAIAGGMISGEPVQLVPVRECLVKGIDVTHPIETEKVVEMFEPALKSTTFHFYNKQGERISVAAAVRAGESFKLYRYWNLRPQDYLGELTYTGPFPGIRSEKIEEMIFTECHYVGTAQ